MEWELKTQMVQLGNSRYKGDEHKKAFQDFVIEHINKFDSQAWDMFSNLCDIIPDEMKADLQYWKAVYEKIKDIDCNDFGFRSGMRIALIQEFGEMEFTKPTTP